MKKVMAIFGAALLLAGVATSCNKKCECKEYFAGELVGEPYVKELDKDSQKSCSDLNTYTMLGGVKTGIECTPKVF